MTTDTITRLIQAAEQALDACCINDQIPLKQFDAITALTTAIEAAKVKLCPHDSDSACKECYVEAAKEREAEPVGLVDVASPGHVAWGKDGIPPAGTELYITPQPQVPEDMVLVPKRPTHEMLEAIWGKKLERDHQGSRAIAFDKYKAMLAAAPKGGKK